MKKMTDNQINKAIEQCSLYYRHTSQYVTTSNMNDCIDWFVDKFTEDLKHVYSYGYSYSHKNEFIFCIDATECYDREPDFFNKVFESTPFTKSILEKESQKVMFICTVGPSNGNINRDTYKLITDFVKAYDKEYVIYTDAIEEINIDYFQKYTNATKVMINGVTYFRWNKR